MRRPIAARSKCAIVSQSMSVDYVCAPSKHNIVDYAASLEQGADALVHTTGFCCLNYYGDL